MNKLTKQAELPTIKLITFRNENYAAHVKDVLNAEVIKYSIEIYGDYKAIVIDNDEFICSTKMYLLCSLSSDNNSADYQYKSIVYSKGRLFLY